MTKRNSGRPGGRYTRPRRGFRAQSHYRERLTKRHMRASDVLMASIPIMRKWSKDEDREVPPIRGDIPAAPYVPIDAARWKGGRVARPE